MKHKKAFIFSIDAFVAFSISLLALYSLIFFSAIPQTYYSSLMQAHNLAKDSIHTLSIAPAPDASKQNNALGYMVLTNNGAGYLDELVPEEFGYVLEAKIGNDWEEIKSTKDNKIFYKKLKAVSYGVVFDFQTQPDSDNPFGYLTCGGARSPCFLESTYEPGDLRIILVRLTIYA